MAIKELIRDIDNQISELFHSPELYNLSPFSVKELRNCIIFEFIKAAYDKTEERMSLRSHRGTDEDYQRQQDSRNIHYAEHYRNLQYEELKRDYGHVEPELLSKDMCLMENRIEGHSLTAMQYFEISALEKNPLLKAIVNKRICEVKKISNSDFIEYMDDYDELTTGLKGGLDGTDEDVLFSFIQLFTLEWKYNVELFYKLSVEAEKVGVKEVDRHRCAILCADLTIPWPLDESIRVTSHCRFIPYRNMLASYVFSDEDWEEVEEKIYHYMVIKEFMILADYNGETMVDEFVNQTTPHEWAEFIRENIDLLPMYENKKWTRERIRYCRKIYRSLTKQQKKPKGM